MLMSEQMTDFEALSHWRGLHSDTERMEAIFMGQREAARDAKGALLRLDYLNGSTKQTATDLRAHLGEHGEQTAGIKYVKRWGGYGTGLLVTLAIIFQIVTVLTVLWKG